MVGEKKGATPLVKLTVATGQQSGTQQVHTRVALPAVRAAVGLILTFWDLDFIGERQRREDGGRIKVIVRGGTGGRETPATANYRWPLAP
jgi:hypothetical protein